MDLYIIMTVYWCIFSFTIASIYKSSGQFLIVNLNMEKRQVNIQPLTVFRNSRSQIFYKTSVLKNLAKFTGKHVCWKFFFNKVAGLQPIKKEIPAQVFSCEFLWIYWEHVFYRAPLDDCFCLSLPLFRFSGFN